MYMYTGERAREERNGRAREGTRGEIEKRKKDRKIDGRKEGRKGEKNRSTETRRGVKGRKQRNRESTDALVAAKVCLWR